MGFYFLNFFNWYIGHSLLMFLPTELCFFLCSFLMIYILILLLLLLSFLFNLFRQYPWFTSICEKRCVYSFEHIQIWYLFKIALIIVEVLVVVFLVEDVIVNVIVFAVGVASVVYYSSSCKCDRFCWCSTCSGWMCCWRSFSGSCRCYVRYIVCPILNY